MDHRGDLTCRSKTDVEKKYCSHTARDLLLILSVYGQPGAVDHIRDLGGVNGLKKFVARICVDLNTIYLQGTRAKVGDVELIHQMKFSGRSNRDRRDGNDHVRGDVIQLLRTQLMYAEMQEGCRQPYRQHSCCDHHMQLHRKRREP